MSIKYIDMGKDYAVIQISGKQYKVSENDEILVDKIKGAPAPAVLLMVTGGKVNIGKPSLENAKVGLKIITEMEKGEKIDVLKYKSKSRYRKHIGFRPQFTRLLVTSIKLS